MSLTPCGPSHPPKKIAGTSNSKPSDNDAEIQYLFKLQESEDLMVWRAQLWGVEGWADVVIKWYRTESESIWRYENEVACYRQATSMQASSCFLLPFTRLSKNLACLFNRIYLADSLASPASVS